ncbi:MAG: glutathione peroxidase [Pyrinomonadaceae bacterium]
MKKNFIGVGILMMLSTAALFFVEAKDSIDRKEKAKQVYDFTLKDVSGKEVKLEQYRGKVVMIVNVASRCGYTPQYDGLQKIYERYKDRGFVVLGFPANNFGGQEPGTNAEIKDFCRLNYGVKFPIFSKISVKGEDKHPLYKYLTEKETDPDFAGEIKWNFNKFLIGKEGKVLARFDSKDEPESTQVTKAIEQALQ